VKLKTIIDRVKAECPGLSGRVGGTADFIAATAPRATFPVPHAFVLRLAETVEGSVLTGGLTQQPGEEAFGIVVCVGVADREGVSADDTMEDLKAELLVALKGWDADPDAGLMEYRGYETIELTPATLWRRFDFSILSGDAGSV
jgi:hypothetical protein